MNSRLARNAKENGQTATPLAINIPPQSADYVEPVVDPLSFATARSFEALGYGAAARVPERPIKRILDIVLALTVAIVTSPFLVMIWLAVRLTSRGPGLYWSQRLGRFGKAFWMPKFRSMVIDAPVVPREELSGADSHITTIGHILRRTSLDELPQLWSIIVGDMSIVGPRPLLPTDNGIRARWSFPEGMVIRPGVTGLAQISGRNLLVPRSKARYDAFYARKGGLLMDARILWGTALVMLSRRGLL